MMIDLLLSPVCYLVYSREKKMNGVSVLQIFVGKTGSKINSSDFACRSLSGIKVDYESISEVHLMH